MRRFLGVSGIVIGAIVGCRIPSQQSPSPSQIMAPSTNAPVRLEDPGDLAQFRAEQEVRENRPTQALFNSLPRGAAPSAIVPAGFGIEPVFVQSEPLPPPDPDQRRLNAQPQVLLTLTDLEAMAFSGNPAIAEAAAQVQAMRGKYVQVGLPPNPVVGYSGQQLSSHGLAEQQGVYVGQEFVMGGKLGLNREAAAWDVQRAEQQFAALRQRVLTDVRVGYYELLIAQERLAMTERLAGLGQQAVEAVDALLRAKEASGTDLLQAKVEADTARMLVENARAARLGAWQRLASVLGNSELPVAEVAGDIAKDLPKIEFDAALARVLAESPQLAAQYAEIERARWEVNRARVEVIPNIEVQAVIQDDRGTNSSNGNLQVTLPLPLWNRNQGGVLQAQGELVAAEQAANRLALALQKRLANTYQQYQMSRQQVDRYSEDILPNVDETLRLTTEGYRAGEFSFLQLLTAQRTYFQTHLAYLDALRQMWSTSRQIEGMLLSDSLESGVGDQ